MKCVVLGFCISSCLIAIALAIPLIEAEDDLKPKRYLSRMSPKPVLPHDMWIAPNQMEVNKIYHLKVCMPNTGIIKFIDKNTSTIHLAIYWSFHLLQ